VTDDDVEALARALRLDEAAALACRKGLWLRAFELALEARDHTRATEAARGLATIESADDRRAMGNRARAAAVRRGDATAEGIVAEAVGELDDAASLYERGGAWARAAAIHRTRGDLAKEGRALERQCRADPTDEGSRVALARVLIAASRFEPALRALGGVHETPEVLALRARAHGAMGLRDSGEPAPPAVDAPVVGAGEDGMLFGRYEVVREVASTASSRVLEARDRLMPDRPRVALKIFTGGGQVGAGRDALVRFQREMDILLHVDAKGLLRARDVLPEGPTIVLPWMSGGSLEALIAKGPVAPRRAVEILSRVLEALEAAHRRGIVHRDLKPANVLLDEAGGAFLADFGVAHLGDASATATAGMLGTLRYMSPEQKMGEPASSKSDVYGVGLIALELFALPQPPAPLPSSLTPDVSALLIDMLRDDPTKRPDAATARRSMLAIAWPDHALTATASSDRPPSSLGLPPRGERFVDDGPRARRDLVLGRREVLVGQHDPRAKLAAALAVLDHPALPIVCGVDAATGALRVEAIEGQPVTRAELTSAERALIDEALEVLQAKGITDDALLRSIRRTPRGVVIALPD
jgi:hypothetical protein